MKQLVLVLILSCISHPFWAQAEYKKVREMFAVPHTNIDVHVLKGHMDGVHPVEFFLGNRGSEVNGYYRLVSSGETFTLEGEWTDNVLILSEISNIGDQLGFFSSDDFDFNSSDQLQLSWRSIANDDLLPFLLEKSTFRDFAPLAFKSTFNKYCDYSQGLCFALDIYEENEAVMIHLASAKREQIRVESINPLVFYDGDSIIYEQTSDKLRANRNGVFQYFIQENSAEIKRVYYASKNILSDVEYPILSNKAFNSFVTEIIEKEKKITRDEIKELTNQRLIEPEASHYQYKWNGWTEIDFLGTSVISGRIILNRIVFGEVRRKVIPFLFDLSEEESSKVIDHFKSDIDINSFFEKRIGAEILENPSFNNLKISDFKYFSLSDNHVLISTDFDPYKGCSVIRIPYDEVKNWVKRNSLIKKIMRA